MKFTRSILVTLLALVLLIASACGGGGASPTPTPTPTATIAPTPMAGYETHTDLVYGFSISYPEDWDEWPEEYLIIIEETLVGYLDHSSCDGFVSNFSVGQEKLLVSMTIQAYWEAGKQDLEAEEEYISISKEELTIGGRTAIKHVYTVLEQGETYKCAQASLIEGKTAWIITCISAPNCWNQYEPVFDTIINSFQLLGGGGAASTPTPTPTAAYETYTDMANGFSISYPENWDEWPEESMEEGMLVVYLDPSPCGGGNSNFIVAQEELQVSMSVQAWWEVEKQYLATLEGYAPISKEEIAIYGLPAIKHMYIFMYQGHTVKSAQAHLVEGKTAWVIGCISAPNCWSQYEPVFDTIINSFQLLD